MARVLLMLVLRLVYQLVFCMPVSNQPRSVPRASGGRGPVFIAYDASHDVLRDASQGGSQEAWRDDGPLVGKRLAVKDNIDVAGFETTAACPAFAYAPQRSAEVVRRLQEAGMRVVGKTNLDQFACGLVGTRSPYGAVPNSFDERYVSGGSSSGSAVAVARGLADAALGTDTAGSGRVPAGFNNIVGLKPSRGLISTRGVVPACRHIDCVSIFAPTVADAVDVFVAAVGHDPDDPHARALPLDRRPMPGSFRFGVPDPLTFSGDAAYEAAFDGALERLAGLGGRRSAFDFAPLAEVARSLYEGVWVAERYAAIKPFFDAHADEMDPVVRTIIGSGTDYGATDLFAALDAIGLAQHRAASLWDTFDVLVVPTAPTIYRLDALRADPIALNRNLGTYTNFVNLLDMAAIAVPSALLADGLPFGITLIGPAGSDLRLADLAQRYHHATGLTVGATGRPLPPPRPLARPATDAAAATVDVAVVGAHLSGMPLNGQLTACGAQRVAAVETAPCYRLYALSGTTPRRPGLVRVASGGGSVATEVWRIPLEAYGAFVAQIPAPLGIGSVELSDGSRVQGFVCEAVAVADAEDITHFGGWRAYQATIGCR